MRSTWETSAITAIEASERDPGGQQAAARGEQRAEDEQHDDERRSGAESRSC